MAEKVVDARADKDGNITFVKLEGNSRFTSVETAMGMDDRGEIENAHTVRSPIAKDYLRTNPDNIKSNNLDDMAGDS